MKKVCLIYANCQNALIAKYLSKSQLFNQEYSIKAFPVHKLMQQGTKIPDRWLKQAKLFIYQPVKDIHGDRSTNSILSELPSDCEQISFPPLYFTGYFPQYCKNPVRQIINPNYPFGVFPHGDTNIIEMLEQGKSVAEIIEKLSDRNFYTQEFLIANLNQTLAELARRESQLSIKVSNFIETHYQDYYLFHTQNHPTDILGIYVVNQILKLVNLPRLSDPLQFKNPMRGQLDAFQIPIYPSVFEHLNLTFADDNMLYKHRSFCTNRMSFARYIDEYVNLHLSAQTGSNFYHFQGIKHRKQNKLNQAVKAQQEAIAIKPNNAAYYQELGNVLLKLKRLDQAEIIYKKAIELSPDWVDFYQSLASILIEKNDLSGLILNYKQAVRSNPQHDQFYHLLGEALVNDEKLDEAKQAYFKAIELKPSQASYYCSLGDVFKQQNNLDLAIINYQKAIAINSDNPWLYIRLAKVLATQNQLDEAMIACQKARKLDRQEPNFLRIVGDLQLQKGDVDQALSSYQQAIKLNTNQAAKVFAAIGPMIKEKVVDQDRLSRLSQSQPV